MKHLTHVSKVAPAFSVNPVNLRWFFLGALLELLGKARR